MKRICLPAASAVFLMLPIIPFVYGQKTTEQYIPMGKSPGVTRKYSMMGEIEQFDPASKSLTVISSSGKITMKVRTIPKSTSIVPSSGCEIPEVIYPTCRKGAMSK